MVVGSGVTTSARWARLTAALRRASAPRLRAFLDQLGEMKASLLRRVPQRFHAISDEVAKFGTIGLINLGVNFAVFNALLAGVQGSEVKAKVVATVVAATCAYFLNRYWTYRHRPKTTLRREYSLFFLFNAVGLVIEAAIISLAKYGFDATDIVVLNVCTFIGIALGTVFRFWAYRTHVFKKEPEAESANASPQHLASDGLAVAELRGSEFARAEPHGEPGIDEPAGPEDDLRDELVQLELDDMLDADDPVRR
jgi:putative flippase GtrA